MLLNRFEKLLMNNPVRAALQRGFEGKRLLAMGGPAHGRVLEIGCGRGVGASIILDRFGASHVDAFDLDGDMVRRAQKRLAKYGDRARVWTGDATQIEAADESYDAVFDFGIIHHIPAWRSALAEVHRVLKPGGRFYAEEIFARFILHPLWRRLFEHPLEDRFDHDQFVAALEEAGFEVLDTRDLGGQAGWFVADRLQPN